MPNVINSHKSSTDSTGVLLGALRNPLAIAASIAQRVRGRRELNRLLNLPDYQLKDIGLQRHDIQREALKPFWRA